MLSLYGSSQCGCIVKIFSYGGANEGTQQDDPKNSEFCHWIATGFSVSQSKDTAMDWSNVKHVVDWQPPGPPAKTGKHRYVFVALVPTNGTLVKLDLRGPDERANWGYGKERHGVRQWAKEMGLSIIGTFPLLFFEFVAGEVSLGFLVIEEEHLLTLGGGSGASFIYAQNAEQ